MPVAMMRSSDARLKSFYSRVIPVENDGDPGPAGIEGILELTIGIKRVDGAGDRSRFPDSELGDHELQAIGSAIATRSPLAIPRRIKPDANRSLHRSSSA